VYVFANQRRMLADIVLSALASHIHHIYICLSHSEVACLPRTHPRTSHDVADRYRQTHMHTYRERERVTRHRRLYMSLRVSAAPMAPFFKLFVCFGDTLPFLPRAFMMLRRTEARLFLSNFSRQLYPRLFFSVTELLI